MRPRAFLARRAVPKTKLAYVWLLYWKVQVLASKRQRFPSWQKAKTGGYLALLKQEPNIGEFCESAGLRQAPLATLRPQGAVVVREAPRASRDAPTSKITQQRLAPGSPRKGKKRAAANERGRHGRRVGIGLQTEEPHILLDGHDLVESTNVEHPQGHIVAS